MTTPIIIDPSFLFPYLFLGLDLSLPDVDTIYHCLSVKDRLDLSAERVRRTLIAQVDQLAATYQFQEYQWVWADSESHIIDYDYRQLLRVRLPADSCDVGASVVVTWCSRLDALQFRSRSASAAPMYILLQKERKWLKALRRTLLSTVFLHKNPGQAKIASFRKSYFEPAWGFEFDPAKFYLLLYLFPPRQTTITIEGKVLLLFSGNFVHIDFGFSKDGIAQLEFNSNWSRDTRTVIELPTWDSCSKAVVEIASLVARK